MLTCLTRLRRRLYCLWALAQLRSAKDSLRAALKERDAWKAAHDNQVELKRIIADRPDLADRAVRVAALIRERDSLLGEIACLRETVAHHEKHSWANMVCEHHTPIERATCVGLCPVCAHFKAQTPVKDEYERMLRKVRNGL